jgi:putative transposase
VTRFRFIDDHQAAFDIRTMCRVLGVSASGYYAWRTRPPSQRQLRHEALGKLIDEVHADSRRTYGYRRVHAELTDGLGLQIGRDQVGLVMARSGLQGLKKRRKFSCTVRDETARPAPDLVDRNFVADAPDQLYVADITYVPTAVGFAYLAVVLDVFSRRIVGWSIDNHQRASLVVEALQRALAVRRPHGGVLAHHSDQGTQYTSREFELACRAAGIDRSMGSVGDAYDNAMVESFFGTLEDELFATSTFRNRRHAALQIADYIDAFYNRRRRHSALGNISPAEHERRWHDAQQQAA